ncbi:MAG: cytochrome c oxidase assembly protein [Methylococcaceae bacterium]|nr:MAG: cytochrome c oxidase assembly protein [Methylococcaceae bacterium]
MTKRELDSANRRLMVRYAAIALVMFGFGYALVPLYDALCEATGLNGKVVNEAVVEQSYAVDAAREVSMEFITTVNERTPLAFRAETAKLRVHPGQYYTVMFYAENTSPAVVVAQAVPSVAPGLAAEYLKKVECFCFSKQTFDPGKEKAMPVRFVIDPALPKNVKEMTLSYTFFDVTGK